MDSVLIFPLSLLFLAIVFLFWNDRKNIEQGYHMMRAFIVRAFRWISISGRNQFMAAVCLGILIGIVATVSYNIATTHPQAVQGPPIMQIDPVLLSRAMEICTGCNPITDFAQLQHNGLKYRGKQTVFSPRTDNGIKVDCWNGKEQKAYMGVRNGPISCSEATLWFIK